MRLRIEAVGEQMKKEVMRAWVTSQPKTKHLPLTKKYYFAMVVLRKTESFTCLCGHT